MESELVNSVTKGVSSRITSHRVALQFVLEELDAASQGNDAAVDFVNKSGFVESEYTGAMGNSFEEVDGIGGPQAFLLSSIFAYASDMDFMVKLRLQVVKNIISEWELLTKNDYRIGNLLQSLKKHLESNKVVMPALTLNIPVPENAQIRHDYFKEKDISSAKKILSTLSELTEDNIDIIIKKALE